MLRPLLTSVFALAATSKALLIADQNCSPDDEKILFKSLGKATKCLDTVLQVHDGTLPFDHSLELRQRYFGDIDDTNFKDIISVFPAIQNNWGNQRFNCALPGPPGGTDLCDIPGVSAHTAFYYVSNSIHIPMLVSEIHICPIMLGHREHGWLDRDYERAPTLIHEMTHLYAEPPTQDIKRPDYSNTAYIPLGAQQIAFWSWELAARNADNYALYARDVCGAVESGSLLPAENIDRSEPKEPLVAKTAKAVEETAPK